MWHRGDWANLAHYGKYILKACPKMEGEGKIMQPPSGDGQGIKKKLKKKAVISIWNVAGINFFITFNLSTGHCHHQSSSVQSDLCHSWQPAVPWGSDQQGAWPLKHPYRMSIPTGWDKHQDQGRVPKYIQILQPSQCFSFAFDTCPGVHTAHCWFTSSNQDQSNDYILIRKQFYFTLV